MSMWAVPINVSVHMAQYQKRVPYNKRGVFPKCYFIFPS